MNKNFWMDGIDFDDELAWGISDLNPLKHVAAIVDKVVPGAGKFVDPVGNVVNAVVDTAGNAVLGTSQGLRGSTSGSGRGWLGGALQASQQATQRASQTARARQPRRTLTPYTSEGASTATPMQQRDDIGMVLAKALAARDSLQAMSVRPKLAARKVSSGVAGGKDSLLATTVANAVANKLGPDLAAVNKRLRLAANQRTATSEHLNINNKTAFRRKVLQDLLRISATLPASHPVRQRIRKVGLFSGLL